nr:hypothetical protein [Eubacterium sp.]
MNEHDLLDAIGGIDPKYIKDADKTVSKHSKTARFRRYYLAAAGLLLLVVAGIVIRNNHVAPDYESMDETGEATIDGAIPDGIEVTEGSEAVDTEESFTTESADSDYPAMVMYNGAVYKDSGEEFMGEIPEDGLVQVSSYTDGEPSENGQQNFDRSSETKF